MSDLVVKCDKKPEEMRWFYVSYWTPNGPGNAFMKQDFQTDGEPDRGMNIAAATDLIMGAMGCPIVILSWHETHWKRAEQWHNYLKHLESRGERQKIGPSLGVVEGGGEKKEGAPKVELHSVPPTETKGDPSP